MRSGNGKYKKLPAWLRGSVKTIGQTPVETPAARAGAMLLNAHPWVRAYLMVHDAISRPDFSERFGKQWAAWDAYQRQDAMRDLRALLDEIEALMTPMEEYEDVDNYKLMREQHHALPDDELKEWTATLERTDPNVRKYNDLEELWRVTREIECAMVTFDEGAGLIALPETADPEIR